MALNTSDVGILGSWVQTPIATSKVSFPLSVPPCAGKALASARMNCLKLSHVLDNTPADITDRNLKKKERNGEVNEY